MDSASDQILPRHHMLGTKDVPFSPVLILSILGMIVLVAWVATFEFAFLLPISIATVAFVVWSFRRPHIAVATIVLLYLHVIERSEDITLTELAFGLYFYGFLAYWFFGKVFLSRTRIVESGTDVFLVSFITICVSSVVLVVAYGGSPVMWFRETLTLSGLLLFFPSREVMRSRRGARWVLFALGVLISVVAINNLIGYRTSSLAARYMWELVGSRKPIGDHYFFPACVVLVSLIVHVRSSRAQVLSSVLLIFFALALALTFSRGFWMAALFGCVVLFVLIDRPGKARLMLLLLGLGAVVIAAAFLLVGDLGEYVIRALLIRFSSTGHALADASFAARIAESNAVIDLIKANPLVGYGVGASYSHYDLLLQRTTTSLFVHNGYLFILFKVGLFGFIAFFGFFLSVIVKTVRAYRASRFDQVTTAFLLGGVAVFFGMLLVSITSNTFITKESLLLIALGSAYMLAQVEKPAGS